MRHPEWIKVKTTGMHAVKTALRRHGVSTVCEEARCPNQGECFSRGTATFMILGDRCTRNCSFCSVLSADPLPLDTGEPERVADATLALGLKFVVITSVTRDDLADGGAGQFAKTIQSIRDRNPETMIEVLTPDFRGKINALRTVLDAGPDVFNHNIETVPSLYSVVRPQVGTTRFRADYAISLGVLRSAKALYPDTKTKSGIMLGLGEKEPEVISVMRDLRAIDCDFLTIGQYLRPRKENIPVVEYIRPEIFEEYKNRGLKMGFKAVASSPLTRSSMNAEEMFEQK
ncbi:MAG TPA: lipoyl synthase [Nitrospirae bacterium]|nr:lipoyl synthase [bacterium BMS3Abin10]GBE38814.1 lipoyl synthase [bacterium BMS3Bbin08]HDH50263.1 lipoyl synthase [Nitrospirota bacterium]HDK16445.1 lipoyl synthase [Nitrospirota bacterium]HDK82173.1 lipoyl synthase [Nitrospirota bacterium]